MTLRWCRALTVVLVAAACDGAGAPEAGETPAREERPADALARRVAEAAGGARFGDIEELRFRFVVTADGERRADVAHRWDVRARRDRVSWHEEGHRHEVDVDLATRTGTGTVDGAAVSGEAATALVQKGYQRWVNDSYWLLLPLKLLDPGVRRELEEPRRHGGKRYAILHLSFAGVGLTPGDQYWLFIDEATARIERWEMLLEGASPPPRATSFTQYRQVGPLHLALDHVNDEGTRHVTFEDVTSVTAPAGTR